MPKPHESDTDVCDLPIPCAIPRLLVATNGTRESRGAVMLGAALSERDQSQVLALAVALPFPYERAGMFALKTATAVYEEHRHRLLDDLRRSLRDVDGTDGWTKEAMVGLVPGTIDDAANRWRAFLILLGLGHHRALDRAFRGETNVAIAQFARVPVIAVHPDARELPRNALVAVDFSDASAAAAHFATRLLSPDGVLAVAHVCAFGGSPHREGDLTRSIGPARVRSSTSSFRIFDCAAPFASKQ